MTVKEVYGIYKRTRVPTPVQVNYSRAYTWCSTLMKYITVCMYVCMYGHHIQQSMDQPGKVANPARGQLNRENEYSPVPVRAR